MWFHESPTSNSKPPGLQLPFLSLVSHRRLPRALEPIRNMPDTLSDRIDQRFKRESSDTRHLISPFSSSATLPCESSEAEKTASERQNPLTRQFTEAEWAALRKFRVSAYKYAST